MADSVGPGAGVTAQAGPRAGQPRPGRSRALLAIIIVVILIVAALSGYEVYRATQSTPTSYPSPPAGWATFQAAWASVSDAFSQLVHGPWTILFGEGVAADGPWSPPAAFWGGTSPALWDPCAAQLSGVSTITFWNSSAYPYSDSPHVFSSGAAPLWTFIFNGTGTPTFVVSWLEGQVVVNAALGPTSPCFLTSIFNTPAVEQIHPSIEVDSNVIAAAALAESQLQLPTPPPSVPSLGEEAFALYYPGPERLLPMSIGAGDLWTVAYGACGLPGQLGSNFTMGEFPFNATTAEGNSWMTATVACYDSYYLLNMTPVHISTSPDPNGSYREWNVNWSFLSSAVPPTWTASDLTTSLIHWQLKLANPPFSVIPPTAALCTPGHPSLANCTGPAQGWYAVLLSPSGAWLDSYPAVANGTTWTVPGVPLLAGDRVLFVGAPGAPATPGDAWFETAYGGEPAVLGSDYIPPS